jgi:Smg protein
MKESVLDVLMYLFEHHFDEDADMNQDRETLELELVEAGFPRLEVSKAFTWLEGLAAEDQGIEIIAAARTPSVRVLATDEAERFDLECRSFLLSLEQAGVLDTTTRELVIDRVMALETRTIDVEQLKWVVLMVLFNQPGKESMFSWMEDFVVDREACRLH